MSEHATTSRRADQPVAHLHALARVECLLRADDRATEPVVHVAPNGARVSWRSWKLNEHARGSLTAAVVNEIAATEAWAVSTIHDPHRREDELESLLTVVYTPEWGEE